MRRLDRMRSQAIIAASFVLPWLMLACPVPSAVAETLLWSRYPAPPSEDHHAAAYDPVQRKLWIQGGAQPSTANPSPETWSLALDGVPRWHYEGHASFLQRHSHSAVYDSAGGRIVVYGGAIDGVPLSDAYWLNPGTGQWNFIGSGTPPYAPSFGWQSRHSVVDSKRRRMLVVDLQGVVFSLDLATGAWSTLTTTGAPPVASINSVGAVGAVCYDTRRDRLICTDPESGVRILSLDGTPTWIARPTTGGPAPGSLGSFIYDPRRDRAVLVLQNSVVWELAFGTTDQWTQLSTSSNPPGARNDAQAEYDAPGDRILLFGGPGGNDTWAFGLATNQWTLVHPGGALPTIPNPTAVAVPGKNAMYVFGTSSPPWRFGFEGSGYQSLSVQGTGPASRPTAAFDAARQRIIIFSNSAVAGLLPELYTLPLNGTLAWGRILPTGTPPVPRTDARATYDAVHDRLIVYGGTGVDGLPLQDVWAVGLSGTPAWVRICDGTGMPLTYPGMQMVHDPRRDRILAIGTSSVDSRTHAWALSLNGGTVWTPVAGGASSTQRFYFAVAADSLHDRVVLHGGQFLDGLNITSSLTTLALSPVEQWIEPALQGPPPQARYGHLLVRDESRDRFVLSAGREGNENVTNPASAWSAKGTYYLDQASAVLGVPPQTTKPGTLTLSRVRLQAPDRVTASVHQTSGGALVLEVIDLQGRRLGSAHLDAPAGDGELSLTLSRALPPGLCLVTVRQGEQRAARKLMVLR